MKKEGDPGCRSEGGKKRTLRNTVIKMAETMSNKDEEVNKGDGRKMQEQKI